MTKNLLRFFLGLFLLIIIALCFYIGSLWVGTRSAFIDIEQEMIIDRSAFEAEVFIGSALFEKKKRGQAKPADILAKNALNPKDKNLLRYQFEWILLSKRLNLKFNDEQLLITWLSKAYLGDGEYGMALAAKSLFNKEISELSKKESVAIAALAVRPTLRNDHINWEIKQGQILKKLNSQQQ